VPRAESKFEVENALPQFNSFDGCMREASIDFRGRIHRCRKTELLAVIRTSESYATTFDKPPQTSNDDAYVLVKYKDPIELTTRERLKPMSDKPSKISHGTHAWGSREITGSPDRPVAHAGSGCSWSPKSALPTRTMLAPSSMAIS
jgi:hypothetical protein